MVPRAKGEHYVKKISAIGHGKRDPTGQPEDGTLINKSIDVNSQLRTLTQNELHKKNLLSPDASQLSQHKIISNPFTNYLNEGGIVIKTGI
jgi:hypothetical protein